EVVITLDFFEPDGKRYRRFTEQFSERAYTDEAMKAMLRQAGLITEAVYEEMSFTPPRPETQREIFVVRKMKT
ncbi:MAG TPA: class I SAM-dependent methyltransferase, partial [Ruminococcaceae bacterium]|nr:class I SAM-dependent methyltransferase [Oscillospiraceae bacterium]